MVRSFFRLVVRDRFFGRLGVVWGSFWGTPEGRRTNSKHAFCHLSRARRSCQQQNGLPLPRSHLNENAPLATSSWESTGRTCVHMYIHAGRGKERDRYMYLRRPEELWIECCSAHRVSVSVLILCVYHTYMNIYTHCTIWHVWNLNR